LGYVVLVQLKVHVHKGMLTFASNLFGAIMPGNAQLAATAERIKT
jgi:hypothetical protein